MQSILGINRVLLVVGLGVFLVGITYQPLPANFSQPWKYCFLSYWARRIDQVVSEPSLLSRTDSFDRPTSLQGSFCERMHLFTRVEMIRTLHYLSIGLYQKRDPACRLKVPSSICFSLVLVTS